VDARVGPYQTTSLATPVGIHKQTLPYYFPTKDAPLEACLRAAGQRVAEEIAEALPGKETYWDRAETVIHALFIRAEGWPGFPMFLREAGRLRAEGFERFASVTDRCGSGRWHFFRPGRMPGAIREPAASGEAGRLAQSSAGEGRLVLDGHSSLGARCTSRGCPPVCCSVSLLDNLARGEGS